MSREKILGKIRALLAKTIENGCTEFEALSALEAAQNMIDAYEVTDADLELKGEKAEVRLHAAKDPHHVRDFLAKAIGVFSNCEVWRKSNGDIEYCGIGSDTDLAGWLHVSLASFVDREILRYLRVVRREGYVGPNSKLINGFVSGCCGRISQRLLELHDKSVPTSNGRALVVAKKALIDEKLEELGISTKPRTVRTKKSPDAYLAGQTVGDNANFGRPIEGNGPTTKLLR